MLFKHDQETLYEFKDRVYRVMAMCHDLSEPIDYHLGIWQINHPTRGIIWVGGAFSKSCFRDRSFQTL